MDLTGDSACPPAQNSCERLLDILQLAKLKFFPSLRTAVHQIITMNRPVKADAVKIDLLCQFKMALSL